MSRLKYNELSLRRISDALLRRIVDIPDAIAWYQTSGKAQDNRELLAAFAGKHNNQRCFIMGNGPSLGQMDLSPLKEEVTFGLNRIYLLFENNTFQPTYFVSVNELVLEQFASEIQALSMPKFLNWNRRSLFKITNKDTYFIRNTLSIADDFNGDITHAISGGGTVTYIAMQIAYFMGFDEVILIGVDHNFSDKGIPNKVVTRIEDRDQNHFDPHYFPRGIKWQLPDLNRSELAYTLARQAFNADGRRIIDATVNGNCNVFDKVEFSTLF